MCPECANEWLPGVVKEGDEPSPVKDANGNLLEDGDHNIDCKMDGIGAMKLKPEFVKKVPR